MRDATTSLFLSEDGKKKTNLKKVFPGYVLIKMIVTEETWYIVRNTPGVTGFIGSSGKGAKPTPLLPQEIDRILANMGMSRVNLESEMAIGDKVNIVDGPFSGMTGKVDNIDLENNRLNIIIDLFGQETNVDVEVFLFHSGGCKLYGIVLFGLFNVDSRCSCICARHKVSVEKVVENFWHP